MVRLRMREVVRQALEPASLVMKIKEFKIKGTQIFLKKPSLCSSCIEQLRGKHIFLFHDFMLFNFVQCLDIAFTGAQNKKLR